MGKREWKRLASKPMDACDNTGHGNPLLTIPHSRFPIPGYFSLISRNRSSRYPCAVIGSG